MKLQELKKSGKGIEEIYKYTNDIILEEEDEEEMILNETSQFNNSNEKNIKNENNNDVNGYNSILITQRSRSVNQMKRLSESKNQSEQKQ